MAKFTGCQKYFLFIDVCDILENKECKKNKEYIDSDDDSITGNNDEIDSQGDDIDDFWLVFANRLFMLTFNISWIIIFSNCALWQ